MQSGPSQLRVLSYTFEWIPFERPSSACRCSAGIRQTSAVEPLDRNPVVPDPRALRRW